MRVGALSDIHGKILPHIDKCELLFICGDIIPTEIQDDMDESLKYLREVFLPWIDETPSDTVILVAGNHDTVFEMSEHRVLTLFSGHEKLVYLNCEEYNYISNDGNVYKIYGSPYCHVYGNWSFMIDDDNMRERMSNMTQDTDFLLTHDAPYGCSDLEYYEVSRSENHKGCKALRDIILEKKPKYNFHGHIHDSNHEFESLGDTKVRCVSILDNDYSPKYPVTYVDIDGK